MRVAVVLSVLAFAASCGGSKPLPANVPVASNVSSAMIEDNFEAARALAAKRNAPLVVEAWAPWCHTCRSLRDVVMHDPEIVKLADDVQFASVDIDRKENEAFLEKFPIGSVPTILIFDPKADVPSVKWLGALTAPEFKSLIISHKAKSGAQGVDPFLAGDEASAIGDNPRAIREYRASLGHVGRGSAEEARLVDSLLARLFEMKAHTECVRVAKERQATLYAGTSRANVLTTALLCAIDLEDSGTESLLALEGPALELARNKNVNILDDDRSAVFEAVVASMKARKATAESLQAVAQEWSLLLEHAAARVEGKARSIFDAHRTIAYIELHAFDQAIKMLKASAEADPADYNPHARLAAVHLAAGHLDEGLSCIDHALSLAYGPRKLRIYKTKIDLLQKKGDAKAERATIEAGLLYAKSVKLSPSHERLLFAWKQRLQKL